jgi:hypothetical protein
MVRALKDVAIIFLPDLILALPRLIMPKFIG